MLRLCLGTVEIAEVRESTMADPTEGYYGRCLNEGWRWVGFTVDEAKTRILARFPEGVLPFATWAGEEGQ